MKKLNIAIVGTSGAVGQELMNILASRQFPVSSLRLLGSARSKGQIYTFHGQQIAVEELTSHTSFEGVDIVFASAGASVSKQYAEQMTRNGAVLIDNSSAFRMDEDVPLVVPEVNATDALLALANGSRRIIANPNCTTIILSLPLMAIEQLSHIRIVHVATYQSASGAGAQAMAELQQQYQQVLRAEQPVANKFPHPLAYNLIPRIDSVTDNDYTKEEIKMYNETRKIMHTDIRVSATCVRVSALRAHSEAVWVETENPLDIAHVRQAIADFPGCIIEDNPRQDIYPMPITRSGEDEVSVGRLRKDIANPNGLTFWCVGDQIRKGAALNAVQIAEYILAQL